MCENCSSSLFDGRGSSAQEIMDADLSRRVLVVRGLRLLGSMVESER